MGFKEQSTEECRLTIPGKIAPDPRQSCPAPRNYEKGLILERNGWSHSRFRVPQGTTSMLPSSIRSSLSGKLDDAGPAARQGNLQRHRAPSHSAKPRSPGFIRPINPRAGWDPVVPGIQVKRKGQRLIRDAGQSNCHIAIGSAPCPCQRQRRVFLKRRQPTLLAGVNRQSGHVQPRRRPLQFRRTQKRR